MTSVSANEPTGDQLVGRQVVVTRPRHQQGELTDALARAGAEVISMPLIDIVEVPSGIASLRLQLADAENIAWIVVSSPNGARVVAALHEGGCALPAVAAIGEATADAIGHAVDFVSRRANAASLVDEFPIGDGRVVVVQGERADSTLADGLADKGWTVLRCNVYRTIDTEPTDEELTRARAADAVVFASGSAATNWARLVGPTFDGVIVVIGPVTKTAAESAGLVVGAMADEASVAGIVGALASTFSP